jgi:16S rRNA (guanine527-N7)-methyltransferase
MKGEGAQREVGTAAKLIKKYRLRDVEVITLGAGVLPEVTRVIRATVD